MDTPTQTEFDPVSLLEGLQRRSPAPTPLAPLQTDIEPVVARPTPPQRRRSRMWLVLAAAIVAVIVSFYLWQHFQPEPLPAGFATSNGRLEATQIDLATKLSGRVAAVLVNEGDFIDAGQVVARMDTRALEAQQREAEARSAEALTTVKTAEALVAQRRDELDLAEKVWRRSEELVRNGYITTVKSDADQAQMLVARSALTAARSQVAQAQAAVRASAATIERIQSDIDDSTLKAPTTGRAQYRLAEPGEVLAAGGKVINMLDLSDVYMIAFLTESSAGQVRIGADARIVLDAASDYVIPATVRFVSDQAQFTPKTVETTVERQKLVFRVKLQLDPELLRNYRTQIKAGLPGIAYVRVDPKAQWPASLAVRLPPQ